MKLKIALLTGDGIGPEVTKQAVKVLRAIGKRFGHEFIFEEALVGAIAIDETGNPLPDQTISICENADAVLFGAHSRINPTDPLSFVAGCADGSVRFFHLEGVELPTFEQTAPKA